MIVALAAVTIASKVTAAPTKNGMPTDENKPVNTHNFLLPNILSFCALLLILRITHQTNLNILLT